MSASLGRVLRTVRWLRPAQVAGQLRLRVLGRPGARAFEGAPPLLALPPGRLRFLPPPAHLWSDGWRRVRAVGREAVFEDRPDWDFDVHGPLFAYQLHQFDWLRHPALSAATRRAIVLDWIDRHRAGVGWDAGPLSLRTMAWLRCALSLGALPLDGEAGTRVRRSLASQLDTLCGALETHLLGNHYLWNLIALVFGGLALEGPAAARWLRFAPALLRELDAQVDADGAHEEACAMYHALLLECVLDLLALARARESAAPAHLASRVADVAARMLGALDVLTHPDGELALVGDSALGVAQAPGVLRSYASRLGVEARAPARAGVLARAGFVRLSRGALSLLVRTGGPSPAHQPGHAHADALSFELVAGGERVITDSGVYEYVPGPLRAFARSTRAHATIEVDGRDQAELWGAHRVGGRPRVQLDAVEPGASVDAWCAGWATPDTRHHRRFELDDVALVVRDRIEGVRRPLRATLPLAPGLEPRLEGHVARLRLGRGAWLRIELPSGLAWRVEHAPYFPTFGVRADRAMLVGVGDDPGNGLTRITLARGL